MRCLRRSLSAAVPLEASYAQRLVEKCGLRLRLIEILQRQKKQFMFTILNILDQA